MEQRRPIILFADDDADTLSVFRTCAAAYNWQADFVKTAAQIITKVNERAGGPGPFYDALVCDINYFKADDQTPQISGVAAVRAIRESHPDLPVVFVSNYSSFFIRDEIQKVGAELFAKPVDIERLFERIAYLVKWNQSIAGVDHSPERRRAGINLSPFNRRSSDRQSERVALPQILQTALAEVRERRRVLLSNPKAAGH